MLLFLLVQEWYKALLRIKENSEFDKLRYIKEPMDLEPVLNKELLQLGDWMTKEAMCYRISALQAMLPAALKAKYEKVINIIETKRAELPAEIQSVFNNRSSISWKDVIEGEHALLFQKEVQKGHLELVYNVKNKLNKKTIRMVRPRYSPEQLKEIILTFKGKHEKTNGSITLFSGKSKTDFCERFSGSYQCIQCDD